MRQPIRQCRVDLRRQLRIFRNSLDVAVETGIFRFASRAPPEGRFAIVTDVGRGMRWTRGCRRRTAPLPGQAFWRRRVARTAKSCGPDIPTLISSRPMMLRITPVTVARKPGSPRRSRKKPLKPLCRECLVFRRNRGDLLACFLFLHARLRARLTRRHSLRPLCFRGQEFSQNLRR